MLQFTQQTHLNDGQVGADDERVAAFLVPSGNLGLVHNDVGVGGEGGGCIPTKMLKSG